MVSVRGWVYVITNKAMPDLIKVGYTLKDPNLRANELDHTGSPHSYVVQYEVLVHEPLAIEQRVHSALSDFREAKEWFRCSLCEAVKAIRAVIGNGEILIETVRGEIEDLEATPTYHEQNLKPNDNVGPQRATASIENRIKYTATYEGTCPHCKASFKVTVRRNEGVVICPTCCKSINIADFARQEFDK